MEFQDICNNTKLVFKKERNQKRFQLMIKGNTTDNQPVFLFVTEVKLVKIRNAIHNYFRKMDGDSVHVYSECWRLPYQQAEIFMELHRNDQVIQIKISNQSDENYGFGVVRLNRTVSKKLLEEIEYIVGKIKGHLI
ncbi:hypothetical protein [Bacillus sp. NPDC094106]|uniref:hypothetical protein n=1 Tax=Bacillus sp. NPDC094106 TaxID=3363949 RepID=UPI003819AD8B